MEDWSEHEFEIYVNQMKDMWRWLSQKWENDISLDEDVNAEGIRITTRPKDIKHPR